MEQEEMTRHERGRTMEPRKVGDPKASGIQCYCIRCPRFTFRFLARDRTMKIWRKLFGGMKGILFGNCDCGACQQGTPNSVDVKLSSKDMEWLKNGCEWYDDLYTFKYDANDIPPSLMKATEKLSKEPSPLTCYDPHCYYNMERMLAEWNGKGTEDYNPWKSL